MPSPKSNNLHRVPSLPRLSLNSNSFKMPSLSPRDSSPLLPTSVSDIFSRHRRPPLRGSSFFTRHRVPILLLSALLSLSTLLFSLYYISGSSSADSLPTPSPSSFINGPPQPASQPFPPVIPSTAFRPPSPPLHPLLSEEVDSQTDSSPPPPPTAAELKCSQDLGSGLLKRWRETLSPYITPSSSALPSTSPIPTGSLSCASLTLPHMPPPTAPHSFCHGSHLLLHPSLLTPAQAPKHRPSYAFGTMQHYHYEEGWGQVIGEDKGGDMSRLCGDHMRDSVEQVKAITAEKAIEVVKEEGDEKMMWLCDDCTLLLVTREGGEHVNLYHTMTDWYNTFLMLHTYSLTSSSSLPSLRLLFLDHHPNGYLDPLWQSVFTPSYPILRIHNLTASSISTLYTPQALWVPAGYSSPIWIHLREDDPCHDEVDLMAEFSKFIKRQLKVEDKPLDLPTLHSYYPDNDSIKGATAPYASGVIEQHTRLIGPASPSSTRPPKVLHVVLISRRPYKTATVDHSHMNRRILNEPALIEGLLEIANDPTFQPHIFTHLHLTFVDFAQIPISQQLSLVATADLLIGMHGAALSHAVFLPPKGALLELQPQGQQWRIFQHMVQWSHRQGMEGKGKVGKGAGEWWRMDERHGTNYGEWRNSKSERERKDEIGDGVEVDVQEVKAEVIRLLRWRDRRERG